MRPQVLVVLLLGTSAVGLWLAWPWIVPLVSPVPPSTAGSDLVVVLDGGPGRFAAADRIGQALSQPPHRLLIRCPTGTPPPQPTPELLQGFVTATQITALAHWLCHQCSPALPLAARAFALVRPICLPPAPVNAASFFAMPCASPFGGSMGALALGWFPRPLPASGRIVGFRGAGREGSAGLSVLGCRGARFLFRKDSLEAARAPRPAPLTPLPCQAVQVYYGLSGEGSAWVGFCYSTSKAG